MKDNKMTKRLLSILSNTPAISLSYSEIAGTLQLVKKEKPFLNAAISELLANGTIRKERKKYRLNKPVKSSLPSPTPLNPKLIEGIFDATSLSRNFSFAFVRTPDKDYYVSAEDTLNAYHNDTVAVEPKIRRGHQEYGIIRKIIRRSSDQLAGDIVKMGKRWTFVCSNPKIHNWFEISDTMGAVEGDKVILTVTNWGSPIAGKLPMGKITEILGKSGDPHVELLAVIRQYNLPLEFPQDVVEAANLLPDNVLAEDIGKRKDLRTLFTFTIDPASAKDFDD
ncbi:MAG: ribonuclease R, partial [Candidatus Cloacimonas sp.]|nr:ribonuclease R [Candidatus Cloacimonas sp.]